MKYGYEELHGEREKWFDLQKRQRLGHLQKILCGPKAGVEDPA